MKNTKRDETNNPKSSTVITSHPKIIEHHLNIYNNMNVGDPFRKPSGGRNSSGDIFRELSRHL